MTVEQTIEDFLTTKVASNVQELADSMGSIPLQVLEIYPKPGHAQVSIRFCTLTARFRVGADANERAGMRNYFHAVVIRNLAAQFVHEYLMNFNPYACEDHGEDEAEWVAARRRASEVRTMAMRRVRTFLSIELSSYQGFRRILDDLVEFFTSPIEYGKHRHTGQERAVSALQQALAMLSACDLTLPDILAIAEDTMATMPSRSRV